MPTTLPIRTIETLMTRSWRAVVRAQRHIGNDPADVIDTHGGRTQKMLSAPTLPNGKVRLTRAELADLLTDALLAVKDSAEALESAGEAEMAAPLWPLAAEVLAIRTEVAGQLVLVCLEHGEYRPPPLQCPSC
jgi:hypothetical protein